MPTTVVSDIREKRVYDERSGDRTVYVGTGEGLAAVAVSGDRTGGFELVDRRPIRDVAVRPSDTDGERLLVATDSDVLVGEALAPTGFGPASAVGGQPDPIAAGSDGRLARRVGADWRTLGRVADVRAISGSLVAAAGGVHQTDGTHVGLDDARDVAAAGPFAATGTGLYRLGNGWVELRDGPFDVVAATAEVAHAATAEGLFERTADGWGPVDLPGSAPVVDVTHGEAVYAVTAAGQFLAGNPGGTDWQSTPLGLDAPAAMAIV